MLGAQRMQWRESFGEKPRVAFGVKHGRRPSPQLGWRPFGDDRNFRTRRGINAAVLSLISLKPDAFAAWASSMIFKREHRFDFRLHQRFGEEPEDGRHAAERLLDIPFYSEMGEKSTFTF